MSDEYDPELEELLRRRANETRRKADEERQRAEMRAKKDAALRIILTPEARERLNNVRLVRPEVADAIENQLIALAQAGRVAVPVSEEDLKRILEQLSGQGKRDFNITIRERGWK
ncbi:DNA-binding protein [Sulfodiicoccus acidiphilus]|uniref:DNA-binding protein GCM10007116_09330 n=1 Tax=Sulfodiicoccus acidiphilus TaxID=1670455 RepID=A0A348B2Z7_9CREN|nr:DNA-binding protein [Sulfodiicoccus acidiphilus]BBD72549.1 DNA-binding protein [Sulfodiicoccus acidiphilus]GGT93738.1 DNA-binding protein [Sulfodiicoccus acidiphilus]